MADSYVSTTGNDTTGDGSAGNPFASPGKAASVSTSAGDVIWVKSGTYLITSTTANANGGRVSLSARVMMRGYDTTIGDDAATPVLQASGISTTTLVTLSGQSSVMWNIETDGNLLTSIRGVETSFNGLLVKCTARRCTDSGIFLGNTNSTALGCVATACTTNGGGFSANIFNNVFVNCYSHANSVSGFNLGGNGICLGCVSYANTGSGSHGFSGVRVSCLQKCIAHSNGGSGFQEAFHLERVRLIECVSYGNSGYGTELAMSTNPRHSLFLRCAFGNNSSGKNLNNPSESIDEQSLTADPFVNAASGDFSLNNAAGGGALLRAMNFLMPSISTTRYPFGDWYLSAGGGSALHLGGLGYTGIGAF